MASAKMKHPGSRRSTTIRIIAVIAVLAVLASGCDGGDTDPIPVPSRDYRQDMRDFVQSISAYAKEIDPDFIVIPQNGHELLTENGENTGAPALAYLNAIDGIGRESLFYGYDDDDEATPVSEYDRMVSFMDIAERNGIEVLVTDYCWTRSLVDDSYSQNALRGCISFAAEHRGLDSIPEYPAAPYNVNPFNVTSLAEAKNFLYLLDSTPFHNKAVFLQAIEDTGYDIVIIDLFHGHTEELALGDTAALKLKPGGGTRLVIAYMSIGEAEDYRYYWQTEWDKTAPSWMAEENPDWPGNYKVRYWSGDWRDIVYGNDDSYLKKIIDAGFDGVYLDIVDAYQYFEDGRNNNGS